MKHQTAVEHRALLIEEIEALTEIIDNVGFQTTGSMGQLVINPAVAARKSAIEAVRKLDAANPLKDEASELDKFLDAVTR